MVIFWLRKFGVHDLIIQLQMSDDSEAGEDVESDNNGSFAQNDVVIRRSCCRYGSGCTHIFDPSHRDRFWHPSAPKLNSTKSFLPKSFCRCPVTPTSFRSSDEQLKSQFICNECGYATSHLKVLQVSCWNTTSWGIFIALADWNPLLIRMCVYHSTRLCFLSTGTLAAQNCLVQYIPHWMQD